MANESRTQTVTLTLSTEIVQSLRLEALMEGRSVDQVVEALAVPLWREWFGDRPAPKPKPRRAKQPPLNDWERMMMEKFPCRQCQAEGR
jgi:hypothetical protein